MSKASADIAKMSFEDALEELKSIVEQLERGEGKLDQAIDAYERGAALKRHCEAKLKEAQEKIEKISLGADGAPKAGPADIDQRRSRRTPQSKNTAFDQDDSS